MSKINNHEVSIFALNSSKKLAKEIADKLKVSIDDSICSKFSDGEINLDIKETVRGHHCFIIQSTNAPVNDNYMEIFVMIDALKRASAKTINVVMPYYGYSRQDRKVSARQPISAKLMADLLTSAGATRILCMDLHAVQIQGFFNIPIDNLLALPVFTEYFKNKNVNDLVVVSPDHGGVTRARNFANNFNNAPLAIIDKRRVKSNCVESMTVIGDVKDKNVVMVDDMVDTAGTLIKAVEVLKANGAKDIYMCSTHGVLSGPGLERVKNCKDLKELVITNTIEQDVACEKIKQLSVAELFAKAIVSILDNKPISRLFNYSPDNVD